MQFACCITPIAPLRADASHISEMVSQLIFGECVEITDSNKEFYKIKSLYDGYEGWCQKKQLAIVDDAFVKTNHTVVTTENFTHASLNGWSILLPMGSFIGNEIAGNMLIGNNVLTFNKQSVALPAFKNIVYAYLNTPYIWGGKSILGIDCSGFVQQVFKLYNIHLPRDAYQQVTYGKEVYFLAEAQEGDLAFFDNEEGKIIHVGILLNNEEIIHASAMVRIDNIDNEGIIHKATGERTHKLRTIKRLLNT